MKLFYEIACEAVNSIFLFICHPFGNTSKVTIVYTLDVMHEDTHHRLDIFLIVSLPIKPCVFFLFILQSILGRYGERVEDAWAWLLPNILPTLSLIVGVLVMDAMAKSVERQTIDRFLANLAIWLSVLYLIAISLTVILSPWALVYAGVTPLDLMRTSQLWLGPFQGLVAASLGAFFVTKEPAT